MSQSPIAPSDPRHSGIEVYMHSTLEVVGEPRSVAGNNGYEKDLGPYSNYQGPKHHHNPGYQQGHFPPGNQMERVKKKQSRWITTVIITSAIVSALVAGGAVGAGLGSSLAACRASVVYGQQSQT